MVPVHRTKKSDNKYSSNGTELLELLWICCNFPPSGFFTSKK